MNPKLQELLEKKIRIYEGIISEIKDMDFNLISQFYSEFQSLENIDKSIKSDPSLMTEMVMKIKL